MLPSLLVATTNPGKIHEIMLVLDGARLDLRTLNDFPPVPEPQETGSTFAENALLKARYYAAVTGLTTVAEDSGLEIDALGGRPGVLSARYPGATYPERFARLYAELAPHARPWTARYVCAVALVMPPAGSEKAEAGPAAPRFTTEATVEGEIAADPRGSNGFGYDPIFYYPPYGATLGEVDDDRKLAVAHRGKAFRALAGFLGQRAEGKGQRAEGTGHRA